MKKLFSIMLGLSLLAGTAALTFGQEKKGDEKSEKKKKEEKKQKEGEGAKKPAA